MSNTGFWAAAAVSAAASCAAVLIMATPSAAQGGAPAVGREGTSVERGRYIAQIGGCNDCHTEGYALSGGKVPEAEWLKGDALGWRGPWGTTYPANLRRVLAKYSEDQWVQVAKTAEYRPPMPWFALHDMSEADLRSFYRFVRSLGAEGAPAPAYLPPGETPRGPYIQYPAPGH